MSILVNGSPTKDFWVERGLRQGDPLSPFLFTLIAEGLARLFKRASDIGKFEGYTVSENSNVSLLQFADDTMVVGRGCWKNLWSIKAIFRGFELLSGLKVNFFKSKIYGVNIKEDFMDRASQFLCCCRNLIPFKFLGIPEGANPRRCITWKPVFESLKKKLSIWKAQLLSIGGRVTLINAEDGTEWSRILRARYGDIKHSVLAGRGQRANRKLSTWWKDILTASVSKTNFVDYFAGNISFKLGSGSNIQFWHIIWSGNNNLENQFPAVYNLSRLQNGSIAEMGAFHRGNWSWNVNVPAESLLADPVAAVEALELIQRIAMTKPIEDATDMVIWRHNQDGVFSVKSCYSLIRDRNKEDILPNETLKALMMVWETNIPSKIKVFGWRVLLNRLPSRDQLVKRKIIQNDEEKVCVLCAAKDEDLEHLLFNCSFSQKVWDNMQGWLKLNMVEQATGLNHLFLFTQGLKGKVK
ncbi:uncharacterized protein LOC131625099 [Vicia villosa]|uniref:uncharacterized protein LOC131625099 n=1 Tax=Vicia villosa TaxID=3911 RepID=UPI00273B75FF|nr:uncharacterized protein LOC131625099 [Vicia villosa]